MALYIHCGAHCANLVVSDACDASKTVGKAVQNVNELGVLFKDSIHFRTKFQDVCSEAERTPNAKLRPLCPTRWTARLAAVSTTLDMYGEVIRALEAMAKGRGHVATRASGLLEQMKQGNTSP